MKEVADTGLFDLAVKDDELLAEQSIFSDEVGFVTREARSGTEHNRVTRGLGEMEKGLFKESVQSDDELGEQMREGEHVACLQKSCQRLSADCTPCELGDNLRSNGVFSQYRARCPTSVSSVQSEAG
jgi:hypothetical protein